jgi:hypothetical protein
MIHQNIQEMNAQFQQRAEVENARRREERKTKYYTERERIKNEVIKENPIWESNFNQAKNEAEEVRDNMIKLADDFYLLGENKAKQYFAIKHNWNESAVKHLISEHTDKQNKFVYYQCNYCNDTFNTLADIESHLWNEGMDHHDPNMQRIDKECKYHVGRAKDEMNRLIDSAIKSKQKAEQLKKARVELLKENKIKSTLPYVPKP